MSIVDDDLAVIVDAQCLQRGDEAGFFRQGMAATEDAICTGLGSRQALVQMDELCAGDMALVIGCLACIGVHQIMAAIQYDPVGVGDVGCQLCCTDQCCVHLGLLKNKLMIILN